MNKINLNSVAFLVLGVFLLVTPALSQAIITSLVTAFFRNIDLLVWVNLAQSFWILNLVPKVVGAALVAGFAWKHLKTRFKVDLPKIKVQTTRLATYSLLFMLCAGLFIFADVPVSDAATTATTGYILDTPVSEYAWLIGAYSDGTYYAIEGSTWDNMVAGVGSTAWATYKTNSTALTAQVLAACINGAIYMKDVAFDMNLFDDIPEDVRVICSYNAEYWEYINSADSSGSPYTVSVGSGVNNGYYLVQDSEGRICYSSTDDDTVFTSVFATNPASVNVISGSYSASLAVPAGTYLFAEKYTTGILYSSIGDGAKIDEPTFNTCFGGHVQGKYTIAVGTTAMVDAKRIYLIFDSNNCVVTSSTSFAAMIQDFFDDVVDDSGIEIFIRSGEYYFNAGVTISNKNLVLTGEVQAEYSSERHGVLFFSLVNVDSLLTFSQTVKTDVNLYVENIALYGSRGAGKTGNGLNLTNIANVHFENVAIEYFDGDGLILDNVEQGYFKDMFLNQNSGAGVKTSKFIGEIHFERSSIIYCGRVWLSQDHQTVVIRFINNQFYYNTLPILFSSNMTGTASYNYMGQIFFTGNNFSEDNGEIVLEGNVKNVRISLNRFPGTDTVITTLSRDGYEPSGVYVTDNLFNSGGDPSVVFVAGTTGVVRGNDGFVTENIVTQTNSTATTFAITTALAGNVTFASYMFDATTQAIADFKVVSGVQTSATIWTVTVSGTNLPASMTCTADLRYKP